MLMSSALFFGALLLSGCGGSVQKEAGMTQEENSSPKVDRVYTMEDVAKHNSKEDCWTVVNGKVSDVTGFFGKHPGGDDALARACGVDATEMFSSVKKHDPNGYAALERSMVGSLKQ